MLARNSQFDTHQTSKVIDLVKSLIFTTIFSKEKIIKADGYRIVYKKSSVHTGRLHMRNGYSSDSEVLGSSPVFAYLKHGYLCTSFASVMELLK